MRVPEEVFIREVGPRDGLQNENPVPVEARVRLIDALSGTGLRRIEVASFVREDRVPQMAGAEEVWRGISRRPGIVYSALVLNSRGAERALQAGFENLQFVLSASETHNLENSGRTREESLGELEAVLGAAAAAGARVGCTISTAWGCPYEGEVAPRVVTDLAGRCVALGAREVSLGDTTGMATPSRVAELVDLVRTAVGSDDPLVLNCHFHDTRGTGLANVLAAMDAGVNYFDASVGGLGGCPYAPGAAGNICTEELVHMLEDMGVRTGVDLEKLLEAARLAQELVGRELGSGVLKAGPRWKKAS